MVFAGMTSVLDYVDFTVNIRRLCEPQPDTSTASAASAAGDRDAEAHDRPVGLDHVSSVFLPGPNSDRRSARGRPRHKRSNLGRRPIASQVDDSARPSESTAALNLRRRNQPWPCRARLSAALVGSKMGAVTVTPSPSREAISPKHAPRWRRASLRAASLAGGRPP